MIFSKKVLTSDKDMIAHYIGSLSCLSNSNHILDIWMSTWVCQNFKAITGTSRRLSWCPFSMPHLRNNYLMQTHQWLYHCAKQHICQLILT